MNNKNLDLQIELYMKNKYDHLDENIYNIIKLEKKNEILDAISNKSIPIENLKENIDIQNLLEQPIYNIAKNNFKHIVTIKEEKKNKLENVSYSNAYKCYKCGNNKTSVVYLQTRSCDEPMTAFIKCVKCQNQFIN